MSGKVRHRVGANPTEAATLSVNERILKDCHNIYIDPANGLVPIAEKLGLSLMAPRKKINILLLGNHSAGKSTFINWYVEEHVLKTGVAIETQGFTFVTSGRKRESLTGNATLHLYPHYKGLAEIPGVLDYATTEISTSKQKKFSLVMFVDTPGLVDGDMSYPFDVNEAILWLGNMADLIFVFFDPIGQALCKRTLDLVEALNATHSDKIRFYLSKADEAGHESDRQRVLMQIVQELCKRPGLNKCGFDMPTIYIPSKNQKTSRCVNQIEDVCKEVEKTINQTIQNTLNSLERDCELITTTVAEKLQIDADAHYANLRTRSKGCLYTFLGLLIPMLILINFLVSTVPRATLYSTFGKDYTEILMVYLGPTLQLWDAIPQDYNLQVIGGLLIFSLVLVLLAKLTTRLQPTLSKKEKRVLPETRDYIENHVKALKKQLYEEYLQQSISAYDL
ncbi:PREDICTED: uncharacterized protein LOC106810952 [Priapulus caudatus]|uniref:Uncharacterized protein LOC106810952 n=1 Tax=Priapulus caudatus TaxID=37621 RepID=A0ABM1ECK0_PRICU|nr:PREDICTED: uncharacterized protein LOC106810952 [Priapulus caudatus]